MNSRDSLCQRLKVKKSENLIRKLILSSPAHKIENCNFEESFNLCRLQMVTAPRSWGHSCARLLSRHMLNPVHLLTGNKETVKIHSAPYCQNPRNEFPGLPDKRTIYSSKRYSSEVRNKLSHHSLPNAITPVS